MTTRKCKRQRSSYNLERWGGTRVNGAAILKSSLRKGQAAIFNLTGDVRGEARIVERAFGIGLSALTEVMAMPAQNLDAKAA